MKTKFYLFLTFLLTISAFIPNIFAQDSPQWHLPEGAKARIGKGAISEIAYSPDGTRLAVASSIGIWIYDAQTGEELDLISGHTDWVLSIAFSPDGQTLASGSMDSTIRLWDAATGRHLRTLTGHAYSVYNVAFSRNGRTLTSSGDGNLLLWNVRTGELIRRLVSWESYQTRHLWNADTGEHLRMLRVDRYWLVGSGHPLSPDGHTLVSWDVDGTLHLWNVDTGEHLWNVDTTGVHQHTLEGQVDDIVFSPDSDFFATYTGNWGTVGLWNADTGEHLHTLSASSPLAFSPDGRTLASSSGSGLTLWDVATGENIKTLRVDARISVTFSPDGRTLVGAGSDGAIRFWDVKTGEHLRTIEGHIVPSETLGFSPDGQMLASGGYHSDGPSLWDAATGRHLRTLTANRQFAPLESVVFSPDGKTLAGGTQFPWREADTTILLWNVATGDLIHTFGGPTRWVLSVVFSPDGQTLASGSHDSTVRLWDVTTGENIKTLRGHTERVRSVVFSPDGQTLASGSEDSTIRLWDVATGDLLQTLTEHPDSVLSVSFSPNGQALASGGEDSIIRLWNTNTGEPIRTLSGTLSGRMYVNSVVFSPDGRTLASGGSDSTTSGVWDSTIHFWEVSTGRHLRTLRHISGGVASVVFSPDGQTLASGGSDGTVLLWKLKELIHTDTVLTDRMAEDVNGDGVIDVEDLVLVAASFGAAPIPGVLPNTDVNGDGVVNNEDVTLVLAALEATATPAGPSFDTQPTVASLQHWIAEAKRRNTGDATFQRGILILEQLLVALTPKETALLPNYPNPFNPETWIPYQLAKSADVSISIYAADGTLVRTLEIGHQSVGVYESRSRAAYWDSGNQLGEPVASGVYFYTLTAGEFTATRKMLIRK